MAQKIATKTTFEIGKVIQPIYTGGPVALDHSGRVLASSLVGDVLLTDLDNGSRLARIEGDGEAVTALALTPSASHLIIASRSLALQIYDLTIVPGATSTAILARTFKPHTSPVVTLAVDRTGTLLATGGADGLVKVWDLRGGYATHTLHGHGGVISALQFFELDLRPGDVEANGRKHKKRSQRTDGSSEGAEDGPQHVFRLASGSEDGKIRIWNLEKSKAAAILDSHVSVVRALDYDYASNTLLSGSRDKTVMIWDAQTWKLKSTIPVLEEVESAGFLAASPLIFTGGTNGQIRIWSTSLLKEVTSEQEPLKDSEGIVDCLYNLALPHLISVHADQTLRFHSLQSLSPSTNALIPPLTELKKVSGTHDEVIDLAYVGTHKSILAVATNVDEVRLLSLSGAAPSQHESDTSDHFGADLAHLAGHSDIVICMDVDWSGCWLATGAKDNTARLWRIDAANNSYECVAVFTGHAESIGALSVPHLIPATDSQQYTNPLEHPPSFFLTGSQDRTIKRWDTSQALAKQSGRALYTRKAHDKDINALDVNHDSTLFASASQDRTVRIWSASDGEAIGVLRGHRRGVWTVRFAPRDASPIHSDAGAPISAQKGLVLTGSGDKTVKIWSLTDYSCVRTFEGHTNSILKVVWLGQGAGDNAASSGSPRSRIASAGGDGLVKVWDTNSGEVECTLDNHEDRVWALITDPRTNELISGGADSTITVWKDTTQATTSAAVAASTARVEQDQQLQNYMHAGAYRQAITLALQLNHPARLLGLFTSVVGKHPRDAGSLSGDKAVDEVLSSLGDEQLLLLLQRLRDWNTNAKTAPVAQRILWALLRMYPISRFTSLTARAVPDTDAHMDEGAVNSRKSQGNSSMKDIVDALRAYTERQYRRIEDLVDESYLVEYTLREMDGLHVS